MLVAGPWPGFGLLDIASAVARPLALEPARHVSLAWQLVERAQRGRILFIRYAGDGRSDDLPRYPRERPGDGVARYAIDQDD